MKKLIFRIFFKDISLFLLTSLFIFGIIVWTIQSINYFDYVTEDGHGIEIYFYYSLLNFPKIINRILPFVFFISIFYILITYESRGDTNIFWINGITKIKFVNKLLFFSILLMIIQIFLGAVISPKSQFKARNFLKTSNIDFFSTLIQEGKFINITKNLTIFINKKNTSGSFEEIFLEEKNLQTTKMIYASSGELRNDKNKVFRLFNGKVIVNKNDKINIINFDQIDIRLDQRSSNTITVPKLQEIDTIALLSCFVNFKVDLKKFEPFNCDKQIKNEIKQELLKRIFVPIYIPIIAILCSFIMLYSKENYNYKKNLNFVFVITFLVLLFSEATLRYSMETLFFTIFYFIFPLIIFLFFYTYFFKKSRKC